jgi:hypothetical protein
VLGGGEVAIEVKGASRVDGRELHPLCAFRDKHSPRSAIVVCNEPAPRSLDGLRVMPYREFPGELWAGEIIR